MVWAAGAFALPVQRWATVRRQRSAAVRTLDDPARLAAVQAVGSIAATTRATLDDLARAIAGTFQAPSALVSILDDTEQHFPGQYGLGGGPAALACGGLPLDYSFCRFVVTSGEPLAIDNTLTHRLVRHHRATTEWGVRSYLGVPLYGADGPIIGAVSAYDTFTHEWTEAATEQMHGFARAAESILGSRPI